MSSPPRADTIPVGQPGWADRVLAALRRPRLRRSLISLVVVIVGWELIGRYVLTNPLFFVPLSDVISAFVLLWQSGELQTHIAASFRAIFYGMVLSIVFGVAFGILMGASRTVADYTEAYVNALYAMPLVAIAP